MELLVPWRCYCGDDGASRIVRAANSVVAAMTLCIVGSSSAAALLIGKPGWVRVERLDLVFYRKRGHGMGGRLEHTDRQNVAQLVDEPRSVESLKVSPGAVCHGRARARSVRRNSR